MVKTDDPGIVLALIETIANNAAYLSEIDGYIGDGDHGNNMKKGFLMAKTVIVADDSLSEAMRKLAMILLDDIGGSMGPIYGMFFRSLARSFDKDAIGSEDVLQGLQRGLTAISDLAGAQIGDKTLIDTLAASVAELEGSMRVSGSFEDHMRALKQGAEEGWESTKDMEAKRGRASRLGSRSIGFYDAGATSCYLLITTLAKQLLLAYAD